MTTRFEIPGKPVPKARPRVVNGHAYTPDKTKAFETLVAAKYKAAGGTVHDGPVSVTIAVWYQMPKSWPKYRKTEQKGLPHTSKPDLDNVIKSILDGLNGSAWEDDAQVSKVHAVKHWYDGEPVTIVIVEED